MDSALRPRDIQARIRAGESPEDVARAAGVPVEKIDAFAAPVMAERDHVSGLAQTHPVRRRGETTSNRPLRNAVRESLAFRGIDYDDLQWDAWKIEGRRWRVRALHEGEAARHEALFVYDQMGRFTVADNDDARWMIGDESPLAPPASTPERQDAGTVDDELAIVRAIQPDPEETEPGTVPSGLEVEDAYHEGELEEVDGVYDIVDSAGMDALYDMLSSFDEDSVRIYAGLVHPEGDPVDTDVVVLDAWPGEAADAEATTESEDSPGSPGSPESPDSAPSGEHPGPLPAPAQSGPPAQAAEELLTSPDAVAAPLEQAPAPSEPEPEPEPLFQPTADPAPEPLPDPAPAALWEPPEPPPAEPAVQASVEARREPGPDPELEPQPAPPDAASPAERIIVEPEQPSLVDELEDASAPPPKPARKPRKRASIPSWDEIMFGGPRQDT